MYGLYLLRDTYTHILVDLALQVLDGVITTRWKVLPRDQCIGMEISLGQTSSANLN
jgi:hypothetical protein